MRGTVVGYGLAASLRGEGLTSSQAGRRQRFRGVAIFASYIIASYLLPGRKRVVPYGIKTLMRTKPRWFREDLIALLDLLQQKKIQPLVAQRFPLTEARQAQELLERGAVVGKIVLICDPQSRDA